MTALVVVLAIGLVLALLTAWGMGRLGDIRLEEARGERDRARDLAAALEAELAELTGLDCGCGCGDACLVDVDELIARLHAVEGEGR